MKRKAVTPRKVIADKLNASSKALVIFGKILLNDNDTSGIIKLDLAAIDPADEW